MKTLRMAAAATLAFTLMACGGVPAPSEPAPEPSADSEVSAQGCTSHYICNGDFSRKYSSASSCASSCPDGAAGCGEERLCCNAGHCEWL